MAAGRAEVVRALQFAAVRALVESFDLQRIMAATHAATAGGSFLLGTAISAPIPEIYELDDKSRPICVAAQADAKRRLYRIFVRCKSLMAMATTKDREELQI
jgi:hypothetical protein